MRQHMQQVRVMRCNVRCDGVGECSVQVKCEVWRGLVGCGRAYACSYTYMLWTCVFKTFLHNMLLYCIKVLVQ